MCSNITDVGPARPGKTIFSLSELKKLLGQENSCVSCVTCQRSIDITPMHLANLKASIRDLLDAKVTKYDVELQGVILAHKNVKIVAGSVVLSDNRSFPLEYVADIFVFKPKIGSKLTGVVNKMPLNREYVSVLVHNIFNVVVYAAHKRPKPAVKIGSSVNVTVTYIDFTGRLPFIRAEISAEDLNGVEEADGMDEEMSPPLITPFRKELTSILKNSPARLQQSSTDVETESSCAENGTSNLVDGTSRVDGLTIKKKKKKKKDKRKKDEQDDEKHVRSPSKKRKLSHSDDGELSSPSKKKKRKHDDQSRGALVTEENDNVLLNGSPINPFENTAQMMADQSIFKAASSTPILAPTLSPKKRRGKTKPEVPELSKIQQAVVKVKSELRTADSGISSSDEKKSGKSVKVKVKQESASSSSNSSKGKSSDDSSSLKGEVSQKKKKKKEKKSENMDDITNRLLEEALKDLKTEK